MATGSNHKVRDLEAAMRAVVGRVDADLRGAASGSAVSGASLRVDREFASPSGGGAGDGPPQQHVVATIAGHRFAAGFEHGLEVACATVMSALQDEMVDSSGEPWPELADDSGGVVGVLDVAVEPVGIAHWALRGDPICAVGQLAESCRARGWRFRRGRPRSGWVGG
jgi:hypothetical protein